MKAYFLILLTFCLLFKVVTAQTPLFPLMSDSITCYRNCGSYKDAILTRALGKDTLIFSKGIGNVEKVLFDGREVNLIHFKRSDWFPRKVVMEEPRIKKYRTLYLRLQTGLPILQDTLYIRDTCNAVFFMTSEKGIKYEQLLFYYDAKTDSTYSDKDAWSITGFGFGHQKDFSVRLLRKYFDTQLADTVYIFSFIQESFILNLYVSKKYGILGTRDNLFEEMTGCISQTWYYPYY
ncbi:MAG: hypothetical protein ACKVTZ_10965 [Bacteroidia bacterium]